jgi:tripartite-type tricarboxylate transporter receptor subunit TctC
MLRRRAGARDLREDRTMDRRRLLQAAGAAGAALAAPMRGLAADADWPRRPVRLVVPFAPGGSSEIVARAVAAEMTRQIGQSVYVENKPGGAGTVAMAEVAKAERDGHTLILGHVGTLAVNPVMLPRQPFDVDRDFVAITLLARVPNLFVVHPEVPARDLREFVALAKARPGQLNYGSAGNGSAGHLSIEYLKPASSSPTSRTAAPDPRWSTCSPAEPNSARPAHRPRCRTCAAASCARSRSARPSASRRCPT